MADHRIASAPSDDQLRQQNEIDAETTASTNAMMRAVGAARDLSLDRREAKLDERERWLDAREAKLNERDAEQRDHEDELSEQQLRADERDQQADQREINAQTTWPDNETDESAVQPTTLP